MILLPNNAYHGLLLLRIIKHCSTALNMWLGLVYLAIELSVKGKIAYADLQLVQLVTSVRDVSTGLFAGSFAAITDFGCRDDSAKLQLFWEFSRVLLPARLVDIEEPELQLHQLAWAKGYEGQELPENAHKLIFTLDMTCPGAEEFVRKANQESMFAAPYKWVIHHRFNDTVEFVDVFSETRLYPDSEVAIWKRSDTDWPERLVSMYRTSSKTGYIIEDRGRWIRKTNRLLVENANPSSRRRRDLAGTLLKSCLVVTYPDTINHLTDYHDRHIDSITKCNYPWALHLVNMLNATVEFKLANTWGYQNVNGSWGGMIGMLQRGEIEFGGTGTFLLRERIGVIRYIALPTPTGSKFIFIRPPLSSVSNLFMLPFQSSVWLSIGGLVILLAILLYPAMQFEWYHYNEWERTLEPNLPNLSDDLLVVVGAVSQQGSWYEARMMPTRIIVLMALLAALNLYAAYTANIVALLQSTTTSINSLQELLDSPLELAAHDNVYNRYYFKSFKDPVRRAIYEERIQPKGTRKTNWMTIEDGIEKMRRGYFAFHVEPGCAYKIVQETFEEDEKCGFHEIDYLNVFDPHFVMRRRSPYSELLRVGSLRIHETGLRTRELTRIYTEKPRCGSAGRFVSVGLAECYGAFLSLLFGIVLAFGIFFIEQVVRRACKSQLRSESAKIPRNASEERSAPPPPDKNLMNQVDVVG